MRIIAIEIQNLASTGMFSGSCIPKGTLGITVDKWRFGPYKWVTVNDIDLEHPAFANVQKYELDKVLRGGIKALFSQDDGLLHIYGFVKGSSDGFANREIKLRVEEPSVMFPKVNAVRQYSFKGCLWDSYLADRMVAAYLDTHVYSVGIKESSYRGNTYCSAKVTEDIMERIGQAVVLGKPIQGDFNAGL